MPLKKLPLRTCIGCQTIRPKRELVRLVLNPEKTVVSDTSGRAPGRGTYLCRTQAEIAAVQAGLKKQEDKRFTANPECLKQATEKNSFAKAFQSKINAIQLNHEKES